MSTLLVMKPSAAYITHITNASTALVTFSAPVDFVINETIRVKVPDKFGMYQINNMVVKILALPDETSAVIEANTTYFDPYIAYMGNTAIVPMAIPVGVASTPVDATKPYPEKEYLFDTAFINNTTPLSGP